MQSNSIDAAFTAFVNRSMNLLDEMDELKDDSKELHQEVRDAGYSVRYFRQVVREQRLDPEVRQTMLDTLEEYRAKLGALAGTPLGNAAEASRVEPPKRNGRGRGKAGGEKLPDPGPPAGFGPPEGF